MALKNAPKLYAYFGHHKCASTYVISICYELCNLLGLFPLEEKISFHENPEMILDMSKSTFLISQTSTQAQVEKLNKQFLGFHVIRDPRDICVSGYYSHLKTHFVEGWPELAEYRKELQTMNKEDGLLREFSYSDFWLQHISGWDYNQDHILEIKMEDLTEDPLNKWLEIISFLGLLDREKETADIKYNLSSKINHIFKRSNISEKYRLNKDGIRNSTVAYLANEKYSFKNLSNGRKKGDENTNSHYRKGKRSDWQNHFNDEHKKVFKERYGELLIRLGYEKNYDW